MSDQDVNGPESVGDGEWYMDLDLNKMCVVFERRIGRPDRMVTVVDSDVDGQDIARDHNARLRERPMVPDDPEFDGTDAAHPAWYVVVCEYAKSAQVRVRRDDGESRPIADCYGVASAATIARDHNARLRERWVPVSLDCLPEIDQSVIAELDGEDVPEVLTYMGEPHCLAWLNPTCQKRIDLYAVTRWRPLPAGSEGDR